MNSNHALKGLLGTTGLAIIFLAHECGSEKINKENHKNDPIEVARVSENEYQLFDARTEDPNAWVTKTKHISAERQAYKMPDDPILANTMLKRGDKLVKFIDASKMVIMQSSFSGKGYNTYIDTVDYKPKLQLKLK